MKLSLTRKILLGLVALLVPATLALAPAAIRAADTAADTYSISWWTVDGGGGTLTASEYTLSGTIGQPDAGTLGAVEYALNGGFWVGLGASVMYYYVYLPLVKR